MIDTSDDKLLVNFKENFPPNVESQILEIDDTRIGISKMIVLAMLFMSELLQPTSSFILAEIRSHNTQGRLAKLNQTIS